MVHYILKHCPEGEYTRWPRRWTDLHCELLIKHMQSLQRHGFKVYWCCYLDTARDNRDYSAVRYWIYTHKDIVRKYLCYEVIYGE